MPLNRVKPNGNMYEFLNDYPEKGSNKGATWNTVKGECSHGCHYCFMRRFGKQNPLHFDEKELKTDLGSGNFIFVGSSCDLWADEIDPVWIKDTLAYCEKFINKYLFQSKNPKRIYYYSHMLPFNSVIGTTIETNRQYPQMGASPPTRDRASYIGYMSKSNETMVTVEPIFDFDIEQFVDGIKYCNPKWVNIGADTGGHNLPEPPKEKVLELISELSKFTEVKIKKNLYRIIGKP